MNYENDYKSKTKEYFNEIRNEIIPFIPKNISRVLDIGCSAGEFGLSLKNHFNNIYVWGVEPNEEAANLARKKIDKVICSLFVDDIIDLKNQKFDCIFFNDVLEHLTDPEMALKNCHKLLEDKGQIIASIPNVLFFPVMFDLIKNNEWKYTDSGVLDKTHVKFYTKKSIIRLFEDNGYVVKNIEGINVKIHDKFRLYKLLNLLLFNKLKDWKFMQFVIVAEKPKTK